MKCFRSLLLKFNKFIKFYASKKVQAAVIQRNFLNCSKTYSSPHQPNFSIIIQKNLKIIKKKGSNF